MNKLVSRNPVQRFKEGKKIVKAGDGLKAVQNSIYNSIYGTLWGLRHPIENTKRLFSNQNSIDQANRNNSSTATPITKKSFQKGFLGDDMEKAPTGIIVKGGSDRRKGISPSRVTNRVLPKYSGVDLQGKTVGEWQNILKDYYAPGTYKNDGIWGDNTENAYRAYLEKQKLEHPTLDNLQLPTSILSPISNNISNMKIKVPQQTYNRSQIREFMRNKGINPYSFNGAQRRALRMVLNGTADDNDKLLVKEMGIFKKGGQLPSRNVVKRFKQKNFR